MTFTISGPARDDLRGIHEWIADDDLDAANQVMLNLKSAMEQLAAMPGMGHARDDLADETLRVWTVHRWLVIYQPSDPIVIVRVVGGSRDIGRLLNS